MSRLSFRDNGEEHNFWQNYTDLISGFLIVFIITSLVALGNYQTIVGLFKKEGVKEATVRDYIVNAELYKKIRDFQEAQGSISRHYFKYNKEYQRFECTVDVVFEQDSIRIPEIYYSALEKAGIEIDNIIQQFAASNNVSFKVVIEGRAAKPHDLPNPTAKNKEYAAKLSYGRARNLYLFWRDRGLLKNIDQRNGEIFISGSGYEGKGRYSGYGPEGEDKNKTFIIQIIPCITN